MSQDEQIAALATLVGLYARLMSADEFFDRMSERFPDHLAKSIELLEVVTKIMQERNNTLN